MKKEKGQTKQEKLKGISGWLILPAIGLFISLIVIFYDLSVFLDMISYENYNKYFIWSGLLDVIFIILLIICIIQFFKKKASAPSWMIGMYLYGLLYSVLTIVLFTIYFNNFRDYYSELFGGLARSILICLIWINYFLKSKRVANTFINK